MSINTEKKKVSELDGAQLDWAVAVLCGEYKTAHAMFPTMTLDPTFKGAFLCQQHGAIHCFLDPSNPMRQDPKIYSPSTDWHQGGAIIERERIDVVSSVYKDDWSAAATGSGQEWIHGRTPLIAAMRCYVTVKLGSEVEVPV